MTPKQKALKILRASRGDDLERAEVCFKGKSEEEMNEKCGLSDRTCKELLDGYRAERAERDAAIAWVEKQEETE